MCELLARLTGKREFFSRRAKTIQARGASFDVEHSSLSLRESAHFRGAKGYYVASFLGRSPGTRVCAVITSFPIRLRCDRETPTDHRWKIGNRSFVALSDSTPTAVV